MKQFISALLLLCFSGGQALARVDKIPGSRYTSGRARAMGEAFLPLADDGMSALFYNPAGLGLIKKTHFEPMNFQFQGNMDYYSTFGLDFYNAYGLPSYLDTLKKNPGDYPGTGFALAPNFFFRGLAIGFLLEAQMAAKYNESSDTVTYRSSYQLIPAIGYALRLAQGIVRIGYSLQFVNKTVAEKTVDATSADLGYTNGGQEGFGFSSTIAYGMTLPITFLPSLNVVARNVLGVTYISGSILPLGTNTTGPPDDDEMSLDASLSISPKHGRSSASDIVVELRDITGTSGFSIMKRLAFGVEFGIKNTFFIRGGYGSGAPAFGIGLKRPTAEFSIQWYGEEAGTPEESLIDQKITVHYQIRAF